MHLLDLLQQLPSFLLLDFALIRVKAMEVVLLVLRSVQHVKTRVTHESALPRHYLGLQLLILVSCYT